MRSFRDEMAGQRPAVRRTALLSLSVRGIDRIQSGERRRLSATLILLSRALATERFRIEGMPPADKEPAVAATLEEVEAHALWRRFRDAKGLVPRKHQGAGLGHPSTEEQGIFPSVVRRDEQRELADAIDRYSQRCTLQR